MTLERKVLTDFIHLYRDFPCLWDNRQVLYSNKEARDQAYEVLLEKYKLIHEEGTILDVKKKIEHMRCSYRREHKKVLLSKLHGDLREYSPTLWYYDMMCFLNEVCDFGKLESVPRDNGEDTLKIEFIDQKPKMRKRKISTIYLPEQQGSDDDDHDDMEDLSNHDNDDNNTSIHVSTVTEAEAFGTTVGLQLKEVEPFQRVIAEKLISDVIFQARLNKLDLNSSLNT